MNDNLDEMLKAAPALTFDPFSENADGNTKIETVTEESAKEIEIVLTPEEQKMVDDFASKIDLNNTQMILQYGAGSQKKIADFSENALQSIRTKDMGEMGDMLSRVTAELADFGEKEESHGIFGFFKKSKNKLATLKAKYDKAEVNINKICDVLEQHQVTLLKDVAMYDKMYELNLNYFKELSMYIMAGKKKLEAAKNVELPELLSRAEKSGLPEDTQKARDFAEMCNRFEKKIYDLELSRTVSIQMAPQLRMIQNSDTIMSEKIQSTLVNTIPLWKNQMVMAIGLNHSAEAIKAQKDVTDMTNALLKKNAETLKMATVETAKASERGIVDIETLQNTNKTLIDTFDEVMKIQNEGREKRKNAEAELARIEAEMRDKIFEMSKQ